MSKEKKTGLVDTVQGQILIGVAVAVISGLLGAAGGAIIAGNAAPIAELSPARLAARPDELVELTAAASSDPDGDALSFVWSAGAVPLGDSPVARCAASGALASCKFLVPGTFGISVAVSDGDLSDVASSSVTVVIEGGYIGLRVALDGERGDEVYRAILAAVDWAQVQAHSGRLLIFQDPDRDVPVYAAALKPNPMADLSALIGVKVMAPFGPGPAFDLISEGLTGAGASVQSMDAQEAILALGAGAAEVGFVPLSDPSDLPMPLE